MKLKTGSTLNSATVLPAQEQEQLQHNCLEILETGFASWMYLTELPLPKPDWDLFTNGNSFMGDGC